MDDLGVLYALQVDRGHAQVAVPELALDDVEGHPFLGHLDGVRVAELVGREAGRTPAWRASWRSRLRAALTSQGRPRVGPSMTRNSGPGGRAVR